MGKSIIFAAILVALTVVNAVPVREGSPARNARSAMSKTSWISLATISTNDATKGYPMVNVKSTADGGSGVPYLFLSDLDLSVIDIKVNPKASILVTLADGECAGHLDPQDPRCPRLILTGKVERVESKVEEAFGKTALYAKHPVMAEWEHIPGHGFYICKLVIERIQFLDRFGGADIIDPAEYLAVEL